MVEGVQLPQPFAEVDQEATGVISIDVDCPWCDAKAGEHCTEGRSDGQVHHLPGYPNTGHLARIKPSSI